MFDIIFLGGGPAGYEGAVAAAKNGLKAAVIEMDKPGGTCLQWGCIPTKALLHAVKLVKELQSCAKMGIKVDNYSLDIEAIRKQKERAVFKLTKGIESLIKQNGVEWIPGRGKITAPDTVLVDGRTEIKGKHIVIATGSKPAELPFLKFDGQVVVSSDTMVSLPGVPQKLLVIGAGAIGLEMGLIYRYLGADVTVVEILDHIIPGSDTELSDILQKELEKQKIKIHTGTKVADPAIDAGQNTIGFTFQEGDKTWTDHFSQALLSVGRTPNSGDIFAGSLGIETDKRGFIKVNNNLQTGVPHIFACGDVIGAPLLAHKAAHQAIGIVEYIVHQKAITHPPVPGAVFTFPELASIGLTEQEARQQGIEIKIGRFPFAAGSRSTAIDEKVGLVKIIAAPDHTLLGAHILGAEAGELMPLLVYGVMNRMKADAFKELIMIHPTLCENTWEALGEVGGFSIHI